MADDKRLAEFAQWLRANAPSEQTRQWFRANAPSEQTRQWLADTARQLRESPQFREQQEQLRKLARQLDQWQPAPTPKPKLRKRGGGRKPSLGMKQIMKLRQVYRRALRRDSALVKHAAAAAYLRPKLPKKHRGINDRTIVRNIVRPVLDERTK